MAKIIEVEGIGERWAEALVRAGVTTTEGLLHVGGTPAGRKTLAEKTGVTPKRILEWVNRADLMRINGVGQEYADLLEASGVDSVPELGARRADNLHAKLEEVNSARHLVRRIPSPAEVERWVAEAKTLPPRVTHGGGTSVDEAAHDGDVAGLVSEAVSVFGSEQAAQRWLDSPNRSLGGTTPRDLTKKGREGVREAMAVLLRLEHGIYS